MGLGKALTASSSVRNASSRKLSMAYTVTNLTGPYSVKDDAKQAAASMYWTMDIFRSSAFWSVVYAWTLLRRTPCRYTALSLPAANPNVTYYLHARKSEQSLGSLPSSLRIYTTPDLGCSCVSPLRWHAGAAKLSAAPRGIAVTRLTERRGDLSCCPDRAAAEKRAARTVLIGPAAKPGSHSPASERSIASSAG